MRATGAAAISLIFLCCFATGLVAQPRFELVPLGVFGGEVESNSSCFLLRQPGRPGSLMLDCGSPISGLLAWKASALASWEERMKAVREVLADVRGLLLTHSHLDHIYGFVLKSPMHLDGSLAGSTTQVYANASTIDALRSSVFDGKVWGDFTKVPSKEKPVYGFNVLAEGAPITVGDYRIEAIALKHPVASSGFLVTTTGGAAYLHLGDTGASETVWARARPLLESGELKAVAVETSFGSSQEKLGVLTGHLTPASLVRELGKLTGSVAASEWSSAPTMDEALGHAPKVGTALKSTRVLIHHIKPSSFDEVTAELTRLRQAGLPTEVLEQGKPLSF